LISGELRHRNGSALNARRRLPDQFQKPGRSGGDFDVFERAPRHEAVAAVRRPAAGSYDIAAIAANIDARGYRPGRIMDAEVWHFEVNMLAMWGLNPHSFRNAAISNYKPIEAMPTSCPINVDDKDPRPCTRRNSIVQLWAMPEPLIDDLPVSGRGFEASRNGRHLPMSFYGKYRGTYFLHHASHQFKAIIGAIVGKPASAV
jgi:hypothetical protein